MLAASCCLVVKATRGHLGGLGAKLGKQSVLEPPAPLPKGKAHAQLRQLHFSDISFALMIHRLIVTAFLLQANNENTVPLTGYIF